MIDAPWPFGVVQVCRSIGVRLFERSREGYAPTPAGEEMAAAALRIEAEIDALGRRIMGQDLRPSGTVRMTPPTPCSTAC